MHLEVSILYEEIGPADLIKIVNGSGMHYQLTDKGTILEGNWDEMIDVAKRCCKTTRNRTGTAAIRQGFGPICSAATAIGEFRSRRAARALKRT
jgi:hypothetical protein